MINVRKLNLQFSSFLRFNPNYDEDDDDEEIHAIEEVVLEGFPISSQRR